MEALGNRIAKLYRHRRRWARRQGLTAWRVYDRDIPGHRYTVDWYDGSAVVTSYPSVHPARKTPEPAPGELERTVAAALGIPESSVFVKVRAPGARRRNQYERLERRGIWAEVREDDLKLAVNLSDYNDTGLFLDHRLTRRRVREEAAGRRFLNLFCYTGSFTVYAAAGGASSSTSVDLSKTYLDWTKRNLALNGLDEPRHETVRSDAMRWLEQNRHRRYELAVLDPPSFSVSKKMTGSLEIQRDHPRLIASTLALLERGGVLYFSTNYRGFELDFAAVERAALEKGARPPASLEEITPASIPEDFRDRTVHRCFRLVAG